MLLSSAWRSAFPGIQHFTQQQQIWLDSAATAQKPQAMLDAIQAQYANGVANVHRAQHIPGETATRAFENAREDIAQFFDAPSQQIIFCKSTTEAINLIAYSLETLFTKDDEIAISAAEHHANLLPWQQLAQRKQLKLVVLPLLPSGAIDLNQAAQLITSRTRLVAFSPLSNVIGHLQDPQPLLALAKQQGALTLIDGAQLSAHQAISLRQLEPDFYTCSAHKVYGPDGLGILYASQNALVHMQPWQFGGEMVKLCDFHSAQFMPAPLGFEAGTPNITGAIAFAASLNWLKAQDNLAIKQHEQTLHQQLLDGLKQRSYIKLIGEPNCALASFSIPQIHTADVAMLLGEQGIAVRAGHHCAMPLMQYLDINGALRVSLALYNDSQDLTAFFTALDNAVDMLL
ncbi:cysteine desulfurase [Pseudomonas sp. F1_0610]|uniref:aminotransferase class V-fold PLP-dependent enzyme n=1 Tax=Pseudomonas sp. F1_0610 TaxID=3114284 RepID=UPI0039C214F2